MPRTAFCPGACNREFCMGWLIRKHVWLPNLLEDQALAVSLIDVRERIGANKPWLIELWDCYDAGRAIADHAHHDLRQVLKRYHGPPANDWLQLDDEQDTYNAPYRRLHFTERRSCRRSFLEVADIMDREHRAELIRGRKARPSLPEIQLPTVLGPTPYLDQHARRRRQRTVGGSTLTPEELQCRLREAQGDSEAIDAPEPTRIPPSQSEHIEGPAAHTLIRDHFLQNPDHVRQERRILPHLVRQAFAAGIPRDEIVEALRSESRRYRKLPDRAGQFVEEVLASCKRG